ncbi:Uncharacterised protein [uncultured archaeon]|nr:Uncharacterised protein [uncultured archaeon]
MAGIKNEEINLVDEGFEELGTTKTGQPAGGSSSGSGGSGSQGGAGQPGARPDFRVVQPDRDKNGNVVYVNVGAMWKNVSKSGNEFYTLRIGQLKLLVFPNNK